MPASLFLIKLQPEPCNFIKKDTLNKDTFLTEHLRVTASVGSHLVFPFSDSRWRNVYNKHRLFVSLIDKLVWLRLFSTYSSGLAGNRTLSHLQTSANLYLYNWFWKAYHQTRENIFLAWQMIMRTCWNKRFSIFSENNRSSHQRCSMKKGVFKNFAKFTGKHLCQSLRAIASVPFRFFH